MPALACCVARGLDRLAALFGFLAQRERSSSCRLRRRAALARRRRRGRRRNPPPAIGAAPALGNADGVAPTWAAGAPLTGGKGCWQERRSRSGRAPFTGMETPRSLTVRGLSEAAGRKARLGAAACGEAALSRQWSARSGGGSSRVFLRQRSGNPQRIPTKQRNLRGVLRFRCDALTTRGFRRQRGVQPHRVH